MPGTSGADIAARIDTMARRDRVIALTFVTGMWAALIFVYVVAVTVAPTVAVTVALTISMLLLGGVNTASVLALISRYGAEKDHVYREDILNLDRNRSVRVSKGTD